MKRMQKLLSCVLLLGLLASCLSGVCFANGKTQADAGTHKAMADNTPAETAEMQQAVVELAAAYLRATANTRYDTDVMTAMTRLNGVEHVSTHDVVGTIAPDNIYLSNCSQFGYALYYEPFGRGPLDVNGHYAVVNNYINNSVAGDPEVVLLLDKGADNAGRAEFVRQAKELLQPGDVVNSRFHGEEKSHTMVYVGDYKGDGGHWTIHSSGGQPGHLGAAGKPTVKVSDWDVFLGTGIFGAMREGMEVALDASTGTCYLSPDEHTLRALRDQQQLLGRTQQKREQYRGPPTRTADGQTVRLYANAALPADVEGVLACVIVAE